MKDKWMVEICTAHSCRGIEADSEAQAREMFEGIRDALNDGCVYIEVGDTLVSVHSVETVHIEAPFVPADIPVCEPYVPTRKVEIHRTTPTVSAEDERRSRR